MRGLLVLWLWCCVQVCFQVRKSLRRQFLRAVRSITPQHTHISTVSVSECMCSLTNPTDNIHILTHAHANFCVCVLCFRQLAELDDAKTAFFSNASHELRKLVELNTTNIHTNMLTLNLRIQAHPLRSSKAPSTTALRSSKTKKSKRASNSRRGTSSGCRGLWTR